MLSQFQNPGIQVLLHGYGVDVILLATQKRRVQSLDLETMLRGHIHTGPTIDGWRPQCSTAGPHRDAMGDSILALLRQVSFQARRRVDWGDTLTHLHLTQYTIDG